MNEPSVVTEIAKRNVARSQRTKERLSRAAAARRMYIDEGKTQREIAEALGLAQTTVSRIVRGISLPDEPVVPVHLTFREEVRDANTAN